MDDYERHGSDELASAGKETGQAAKSGIDAGKGLYHFGSDLHDKYKDHKNKKNDQDGSSQDGEGGSDKDSPKNKNNKKDGSKGTQGANGSNNDKKPNGAKTPFGKKGNQGVGGKLLNKPQTPAEKNAKNTQNFVKKLIPNIRAKRKSFIRRVLRLIKRTVKAVVLFFAFFPLIIIICLIAFPTLFLRSVAYEILTSAVEYVMEFSYNFFGIGNDGENLTDEEKRELYRKAAEDFVSDAQDAGYWVLDKLSEAAYTFFQFCDDVTDDDTPFGSFCDDMANHFYKNHVEYEVYQKQKGDHLDSASLMQVMVIDELRSGYNDTAYLDLNEMLGLEGQKAAELKNYYCTLEPNFDNASGIGPSEMIFFLEPPFRSSGIKASLQEKTGGGSNIAGFSDIEGVNNIPTHNLPIVISDPEHYVYLQGETEPEGYIDENGQHLRDCIIYNPYGNTRSSLNVSTGSDYEMKAMAAYLICVYSACTPYEDQSIADMITKIHEGMHDTDVKLVTYNVEFTPVYYGAIVPRLYQPYVYQTSDGWKTGTAQTGYFEKNGDREINGMLPLDTSGEQDVKGWVDVNGDRVFNGKEEEFFVCLQPVSTESTGKPFYSDSFTVISYDKRRGNMSYVPEKDAETAQANAVEEALGYYVAGIDSKHKEKFTDRSSGSYRGYIDFAWEDNFKAQLKSQERICSQLPEEVQAKYIYRYEFPFTRISVGGNDSGGGSDGYMRIVEITGPDASDGTYVGDMIYTKGEGDTWEEVRMNGGAINGFAAWAYVGTTTKIKVIGPDHMGYVAGSDAEDGRVPEDGGFSYKYRPLIYNHISIDNWGEDTVWQNYEDVLLKKGANPGVYNAKMRYMISVNVTALPNYTSFIDKAFGYEPSAMLNRDATYTGKDVTQGELVNGSLKTYMTMLGIKEEVITANNPQIGTERTYSYEEVIEIIRAAKNQDDSIPELNRKYLIFCALAACGHVQYCFGGDYGAGLHFQEWMTTRSGSDPTRYMDGSGYVDPVYGESKTWRENYGYEYNGLDCSGFVTWIIRSAGNPNYQRLYSETILNIEVTTEGKAKTTENIRSGYAKATSAYGEVFMNDEALKVGDIGVRRKYDAETKKLSGHLAMYIGKNEDGTQNWVEMTRYNMNTDHPVAGARVFTVNSYGTDRKAVYVRLSNAIPTETVPWTLMSPQWMMIPTQSEVSYYAQKRSTKEEEQAEKGSITRDE